MWVVDTLREEKAELFIPRDLPLTLSVCGVIPYDATHVGHVRTFLIFDAPIRSLRRCGGAVRSCRNTADIDDPFFERAARDGFLCDEPARREMEQFVNDGRALNLIPPDFFLVISEEIAAMIPNAERPIEAGRVCVRNGNVAYAVSTEPTYGAVVRVSGYEELLALANECGNRSNDALTCSDDGVVPLPLPADLPRFETERMNLYNQCHATR